MGCCSYKSQSAVSSLQSSQRNIDNDSSFYKNKSLNDMNFFLTIPLFESRKFLKYVGYVHPLELSEYDFAQYSEMLTIFLRIVKKLISIQKNSILGLDSEIMACSGSSNHNNNKNSGTSPKIRNLRPNTLSQNNGNVIQVKSSGNNVSISPMQRNNSSRWMQRHMDHQKIIDKVMLKHNQFINLRQPELKLQIISCSISFANELMLSKQNKQQQQQLHSFQVSISVYHNKIEMEGLTLGKNIRYNNNVSSQELSINLDRYVSFLFASKEKCQSDIDYYRHSYILFQIFTKQHSKAEHLKQKEQKISFEELLSQNPISHKLKFFRDEDINNHTHSFITKFDLELRTQLIFNSKEFLKETLKEAEIQKDVLLKEKQRHKKKLKIQQQCQMSSRQQAETQSSNETTFSAFNKENEISNKEIIKEQKDINLSPLEIYKNYFFEMQSGNNNPSSNMKTPKSYNQNNSSSQNINDLQENQSRLSLEYQESYSCQYNNQYIMQEDEADECDDYDEIPLNTQNNLDEIDENTQCNIFNKSDKTNNNNNNINNNNQQININLFKSIDQQEEVDISQLKEQIKQSQNMISSPIFLQNDSIVKMNQIIEQDEKSSVEDVESYQESSEIFQNENNSE